MIHYYKLDKIHQIDLQRELLISFDELIITEVCYRFDSRPIKFNTQTNITIQPHPVGMSNAELEAMVMTWHHIDEPGVLVEFIEGGGVAGGVEPVELTSFQSISRVLNSLTPAISLSNVTTSWRPFLNRSMERYGLKISQALSPIPGLLNLE